MTVSLEFFEIAPGVRLSGDSLAFVRKFTKTGGEANGTAGIEIGLTDDSELRGLEGVSVSGYYNIASVNNLYIALVTGGLVEVAPELAINPDALSSISTSAKEVRLAIAGMQGTFQFFRDTTVTSVVRRGETDYQVPVAEFATLKAAAEGYESQLKERIEAIEATAAANLIAANAYTDQKVADVIDLAPETLDTLNELAAAVGDDPNFVATINASVTAEADARTAADATLQANIDAEAGTRASADSALDGRLDVLEADPTTATAVAAGDAATLASANTYTDGKITDLIGTAPGVLDTLGEIADAINDDANVYTTLVAQIAAVQGDVDGNEADSDAADSALSGRLDVLEADPTTATAVAAVQADVDQNELDGDAADAALSGRLDVLEADPTTATAVAAVQADVDQNEIDGDAADAALSGRLDTLEADPTTATALADGLALKADLAGATFTGDVTVDEGTGSTIKLETTDATSAGIHIEGPTGSMGYIDTTNGFGNDSLQVYSANFWVRAINNGTGNVIIDGNISAPGVPGPYTNDGDAASNGVAIGSMYYDSNTHVHIRVS